MHLRSIGVALRLSALLVGLCSATQGAYAQGVVLLPADSDPGLGAHAITARAAVERALQAQGVALKSYAAARERVRGSALVDCRELTCAAELCQKAGAELAVLVTVRAPARSDEKEVQVVLVEPSDTRYFGQAEVARGDYGAAAREALIDARAYQLLGPGPHLRIETDPSGADVVIDDELSGQTPYRAAIGGGKHTVELRLSGHKPHVQLIEVVQGAQQPTRLRVALEGSTRASGTQSEEIGADIDHATLAPPQAASRPIAGPLVLGVLGLSLITYDAVLIASTGCERTEPTPGSPCTERSEIDPVPAIAIGGAGVAALGAGILWFLLGGDGDDHASDLSARVSPLGAELRARF